MWMNFCVSTGVGTWTTGQLLSPIRITVQIQEPSFTANFSIPARLLKNACMDFLMKCCVSTDVGTWTNWLTFEPDPDYSPDAGTGLLSPILYALQRGILLRRENPTYRYWAPVAAARRCFKMVLFTAIRGNTFVGVTCALPSALLVYVCARPDWEAGA